MKRGQVRFWLLMGVVIVNNRSVWLDRWDRLSRAFYQMIDYGCGLVRFPHQTGHPIRRNPATVTEQTGHPPFVGLG